MVNCIIEKEYKQNYTFQGKFKKGGVHKKTDKIKRKTV